MPLQNLKSTILLILFLTFSSYAEDNSSQKKFTPKAEFWYELGEKAIADKLQQKTYSTKRGAAKNIILFIGDGMGVSTVTASRIYAGQLRGESGEENMLSFDKFPVVGLSKTYNTDSQTPDSAGTMTAIITGVKTKKGLISLSDAVN